MAWSPQARRAAALARKRRAKGRKPQYGVNRQGKKMTAAQRKKAGVPSRRNARIDRKIAKTKARTKKRVEKQGAKLGKNLYTDAKGNVYSNRKGVKAHAKGVKAYNKGEKRVAKLKAKKRKRR